MPAFTKLIATVFFVFTLLACKSVNEIPNESSEVPVVDSLHVEEGLEMDRGVEHENADTADMSDAATDSAGARIHSGGPVKKGGNRAEMSKPATKGVH